MLFVIVLLGTGTLHSAADTLEIEVDASKRLGPTPDILSSSLWIVKANNRYRIEKFFKENQPKEIQFTLDILLPKTQSFKDFQNRFKNEFFDPHGVPYFLVQKAREAGTYFIIGVDPFSMPSWLSARRGDHRQALTNEPWWTIEQMSPPGDLKAWAEVVSFILKFIKNDLGVKKLGFYVGHEPNWGWLGTEESLFKYYEYAARAAKKVSSDIRVGGIGPWALTAKREDCNYQNYTSVVKSLCRKEGNWSNPKGDPLIKSFIDYVVKNDVPLDFINWHSFQQNPLNFMYDGKTASEWLKKSHLDTVKLYISDWTYWAGAPYPADYIDTEESASNAITSLYYLWKGGVDWHGHDFDISVEKHEESAMNSRRQSEFIGAWPIFTRNDVIKPVYNSFKALSMVTGSEGGKAPEMLDVRFPADDNIVAVSTIKEDGVYLLLSNFVPRDKRFNYYKLNTMRQLLQKTSLSTEEKTSLKDCFEKEKGRNKKEAVLACMEGFVARITDKQKIETFSLLKEMVNCFTQGKEPSINRIQSCVRNAITNLGYPENKELGRWVSDHLRHTESIRSVSVSIKNLPFDADHRAVVYTIDKSHSNSCRFNKITEPSPTNTPCGIGGSVDQAVWKTLADAEKTAANSLHEFLLTKGYNRDQLSFLGESINDYKNELKRKDYVDRLIKKGFRLKDLEAGIKTFRDSRRRSIMDQIEKINNRQEIALEGSKRTIASESKKGTYLLNLSMDPNSVLLIVLKKG